MDDAADHRRKAINLDSLAPAEVAAGLAAEGEEATDDAVGRAVAKAVAVAAAERAAEERADEAEAALLPAGWEEGKLREGFLVFIVLRSLTEATKASVCRPRRRRRQLRRQGRRQLRRRQGLRRAHRVGRSRLLRRAP